MNDASLTSENLSKRYQDGPYVIESFDHSFAPGTLTVLKGPNGSGKTTLTRLLAASAFPTSGSVHYGDLNIHEHPHRYLQHVGIAYDESDLPEYLNARQLLEAILRERNHWKEHGAESIDAILDYLKLDERRQNVIGSYSSGMKKKTQLAAACIAQPNILLLDEPLRGLDTESQQAAVKLIQQYQQNGTIIILSTHLTDLLTDLNPRIVQFPLQN